MTVGMDGGALSVRDERLKVGVYKVTLRLLQFLSQYHHSNNYRIFTFNEIGEGDRKIAPRLEFVNILPSFGWQKLWIPMELVRHPVDVYVGLSQSLPHFVPEIKRMTGIKRRIIKSPIDSTPPAGKFPIAPPKKPVFIGVVYDLGFLDHPQYYPGSAAGLASRTNYLVSHADHIITISNASKKHLMNRYDLHESSITVCYPGVDSQFRTYGSIWKNEKPYFLFVGALKPGKNIPTVLEAYARFRKKYPGIGLVVAGGDYWRDPEIDRKVKDLGISPYIKFLGYVGDEMLPSLYRGAIALLSPSYWEGFGLPIAESMACGTPVIVSDRGSLPEICGAGGIVVKPDDIGGIVHAMETIRLHASVRQEMSKKAIEKSHDYTWKRFADSVDAVITSYT